MEEGERRRRESDRQVWESAGAMEIGGASGTDSRRLPRQARWSVNRQQIAATRRSRTMVRYPQGSGGGGLERPEKATGKVLVAAAAPLEAEPAAPLEAKPVAGSTAEAAFQQLAGRWPAAMKQRRRRGVARQ
ncbi:hypothetical protein Syun_017174 [Stephania yunnanensis]|uniref:Uncharacterized protein n=1 Tax=Stephania yunnanensis TaxID=152371 RepID=A0AAP0P245_9MAGN